MKLLTRSVATGAGLAALAIVLFIATSRLYSHPTIQYQCCQNGHFKCQGCDRTNPPDKIPALYAHLGWPLTPICQSSPEFHEECHEHNLRCFEGSDVVLYWDSNCQNPT